MRVFLKDEAATGRFAEAVVKDLPTELAGWTVLLEGEVGAGKSTFARAFLHALGHEGAVPSPTYTIVEPYQLDRGDVYHVDLYRIVSEEELYFLGWPELEKGCRLIEWAERVPSLRQTADLRLRFEYDGDGRRATVTSLSTRGIDVVAALAAQHKT